MSNEKANDQISWRQKLEDTESLSSETLQDKNAAWEKLYYRLQPETKKKNSFWYWMAAACVLLIAVFFIPGKKNNISTINSTAVKKQNEKRNPTILTALNKSIEVVYNKIEKKEVDLHPTIKHSKIAPTIYLPAVENNITQTNNPVIAEVLDTTPSIQKMIPTLALKEKKALTILHNNELGSPIVQPEINRYATSNTSRINFSRQYVFSNQQKSSGHRAISLTNKIFPQN